MWKAVKVKELRLKRSCKKCVKVVKRTWKMEKSIIKRAGTQAYRGTSGKMTKNVDDYGKVLFF